MTLLLLAQILMWIVVGIAVVVMVVAVLVELFWRGREL